MGLPGGLGKAGGLSASESEAGSIRWLARHLAGEVVVAVAVAVAVFGMPIGRGSSRCMPAAIAQGDWHLDQGSGASPKSVAVAAVAAVAVARCPK